MSDVRPHAIVPLSNRSCVVSLGLPTVTRKSCLGCQSRFTPATTQRLHNQRDNPVSEMQALPQRKPIGTVRRHLTTAHCSVLSTGLLSVGKRWRLSSDIGRERQ